MKGWMWQVYSLEFRKLLFYRLNFWVQFLVPTLGQLMISFFLWRAIFTSQNVEQIGGYSFLAMMSYALMVTMIDRTVVGAGWKQGASTDIYQGDLSRYLLYPLSFFSYKLVSHLAHASFAALQLILTFMVFLLIFGKPQDLSLSPSFFLLGLVMLFFSTVLQFIIGIFIDLAAFWADNVWSLQVMSRFLVNFLGGALFPLSLLPTEVGRVLHFLPFHLVISAPVRIFIGKASFLEAMQCMALAVLWIGIFSWLTRWVYARGLRVYSGVGL